MEYLQSWALNYLVIMLATIFLLKSITYFRRGKKYNLPPGPKPWPIIGNLNQIGTLAHQSIHELSKKYGPLMYLRFGSFPVVVGSSVELARYFLKTHDNMFTDRPKTAAGKYTTYNYSDITWSQYGPYWRQARKMCMMELFSAKRLESYEYIRVEEIRALLRNLFKSSGKVVMLKDFLLATTSNVISRMVLGKNYLDESEGAIMSPEEFKWMLGEMFMLNGVFPIGDSIPWLNFLDLQGYIKRMKRLNKSFDRFLEHVLDEHNESRLREGESFVAKDMVDLLLQLADDSTLEVKLERDGVKAFTQDLIAAGTETSAVTMEWTMSELLKHPEIFQKVTEELDRVIGRERWVEEKDIDKLPYIGAIVKETMRLHPPAPMLVPHQAREDTSFNGYDIPAGTRVLVNVWTIGRDPAIWDKPDEFMPERLLGKPIDVKGQNFELLPFGSGRRMCPGYNLAMKVVQVGVANLLHGFNWRLPDGVKEADLSMEEMLGLSTPRKDPLHAVFEPKLPARLYGA